MSTTGKKKLTILIDFQHTHEGDRSPTQYHKDEVVFVDPPEAKYFCAASWAKDESGEFPTGEANKGEVRLEVQNGEHDSATEQL